MSDACWRAACYEDPRDGRAAASLPLLWTSDGLLGQPRGLAVSRLRTGWMRANLASAQRRSSPHRRERLRPAPHNSLSRGFGRPTLAAGWRLVRHRHHRAVPIVLRYLPGTGTMVATVVDHRRDFRRGVQPWRVVMAHRTKRGRATPGTKRGLVTAAEVDEDGSPTVRRACHRRADSESG